MFKKTLPTVAGVMSAFRAAITDLETVAVAQRAEADKQSIVVQEASAAMVEAAREELAARDMKTRLEAIFG